jgi:hypothetical protein
MKIANNNGAGPFGGSIAFQVAGASAGNTTAAASTASTASTAKAAKANKAGKREQAFSA